MKLVGFNIVNGVQADPPDANTHPARYWKRRALFAEREAMAAIWCLAIAAIIFAVSFHFGVERLWTQ